MANTGISNRMPASSEAKDRREHPPIESGPPPAEDASGRVGDEAAPGNTDGRQTSHKAGSRSVAQKEAESRYPDRSMPPTHKVPGAFGKEGEPRVSDDEANANDEENG